MDDKFQQKIYELLTEIPSRKLEGLRDLWAELGYEERDELISTRDWPATETDPLAEPPRIIATAGANDDFQIIHCPLRAESQLPLTPQRPIIKRLLLRYPFSLFLFSNAEQTAWHLVNVKYEAAAEGEPSGGHRRIFRRLRVGRGEQLRTATERLTMLNVETIPTTLDGPAALAIQQRHDQAFDVEAVTKAFYQEVARLFAELVSGDAETLQLPSTPDDQTRKEFGVRLIGRLLFCWFLRKKQSATGEPLLPDAVFAVQSTAYPLGIYHSLLEPLFFETLNKRMAERKPTYQQDDWAKIPFLNGGLFEPHADDFYQPSHVNTLQVPDAWLRKLLAVFDRYNFTILESTPLDIEVAVDPEMLGKIFENLLAEINPETGESARKATGSYYTPRPIVEYMVDESLQQYLLTTVPNLSAEGLESLFSYETMHHPFAPEQVTQLIQALDSLQILDPACGSGAFPMGILQKVLLLLQKLDPNNQEWKARQLEKVRQIPDPTARDHARRTIEQAFENKQLDYGRKLYLIQNCIYGVDIQPIAVDIAKLRCFLSLIIDEHVDDSLENRGVLALPNLEFHFVCANALIGLGQSKQYGMMQAEIEQLKQVAMDYLTSYGPQKKQLKQQFATVQQAMSKKLTEWGGQEEAVQLLNWHPFEHESCSWFDPTLMLGVRSGFDIVIANPPYVRQELIKQQKPTLKKQFPEVYYGTADLLVYFYARAVQVLREQGVFSFISSNKFMRAGYGKKLRKFLARQTSLHVVVDFGDLPVFEATAYPMVVVSRNEKPPTPHTLQALTVENVQAVTELPMVIKRSAWPQLQTSLTAQNWNLVQPHVFALLEKLRASGPTLEEYVEGKFYYGIKTGYNKAFVLDQTTRDKLIAADSRSAEVIKPWLAGRDVKRWRIEWPDNYVIAIQNSGDADSQNSWETAKNEEQARKIFQQTYPAIHNYLSQYEPQLRKRYDQGRYWWEFRACAYYAEFEKPKIIYQEIATYQAFAYTTKPIYLNKTCFFIPGQDFYLLGILNANVTWFFLGQVVSTIRGGAYTMQRIYLEQLPIAKPSPSQRTEIEALVQKCLAAKGKGVAPWEAEINRLVYQLYDLTPKEIAIIEGR